MTDDQARSSWLPKDLWGRIFSITGSMVAEEILLEAAKCSALPAYPSSYTPYSLFRQLPLVCKSFDGAFTEVHQLSACMVLKAGRSRHRLKSLLPWRKRHKDSVQAVVVFHGTPRAATALTKLATPLSTLSTATLITPGHMCMQALSALTSIQVLSLHTTRPEVIILEPLHTLSRLNSLTLGFGVFFHVKEHRHLTNLSLDRATVAAAEVNLLQTLMSLNMSHSALDLLDPLELPAFTALKSLVCDGGQVMVTAGFNYQEHLTLEGCYKATIPSRLSGLISLTKLDFSFHSSLSGDVDASCPWLYELTRLQSLSLTFHSKKEHIELTESLTRLPDLRTLSLTACCGDLTTVTTLTVKWDLMHALQQLSVSGGTIKFSKDLLGLPHLKSLTSVCFKDCMPGSVDTAMLLGALLDTLAAQRPDVEC